MRTSWGKQVFIGVLVIAGSLLLTSGAHVAAAPATRVACGQCEETDRFVRLQAVTADGRPGSSQQFAHPFALSPEDWKSILTELHVRRQAEGLPIPAPPGPVLSAFTEEEISYLSVTLSRAFAQAQPDEWVVFGLNRSTPHGLTEITTGGGYVEGVSLHVILANYRKVATMPSTRELLWERPLHPDAGPSYDLIAGNYQTIVQDPSSLSSLLTSSPSELVIAYQALLLREPVTGIRSQEILAMDQSLTDTPKIVPPPLSIEERLQVLKRLQAQGLITEEEYRAKKQQLLDRL